jgi:hypothetical protein
MPHHVPLQPVQAPFFPNPMPMPFPCPPVPNPYPQQEFMQRHPPMSKYYITDCWMKGDVVF